MIRFYSTAYKGQHIAQPLSIKPPEKLSKSNLTMRTLSENIEEYLLLQMVNHHLGSFLLLWADVAAVQVLLIFCTWLSATWFCNSCCSWPPTSPSITTFKTAYFGEITKNYVPVHNPTFRRQANLQHITQYNSPPALVQHYIRNTTHWLFQSCLTMVSLNTKTLISHSCFTKCKDTEANSFCYMLSTNIHNNCSHWKSHTLVLFSSLTRPNW